LCIVGSSYEQEMKMAEINCSTMYTSVGPALLTFDAFNS
jgi:hypothetical protein